MTLTQKETMLLQDLKAEEQLCVEKYAKYSSDAQDGQLKNLFTEIGQVEQHHYDILNQILSGTVPQPGGGNQQQSQAQPAMPQSTGTNNSSDKYLCSDALSTEKHVSSMYDTCIFEFKDVNIRNTLNHIQKEEQEHGDKIYNYMSQHGMYN